MSISERGLTLNGVKVLVTRPARQANGLCQAISARGGEPLRYPVLVIHDLGSSSEITGQVGRIASADLLIFISTNAVELGLGVLGGGLPQGCRVAVIGEASARRLETLTGRGPDLIPVGLFNSEGLLALPELADMSGKRVVIFRGAGGRELLADTLRERGASVEYLEVYRRALPDPGEQGEWPGSEKIDIVTVTSGEALSNLMQMVPAAQREALRCLPLVVVSERIGEQARAAGFCGPVYIAHSASDDSIISMLEQWANNRN